MEATTSKAFKVAVFAFFILWSSGVGGYMASDTFETLKECKAEASWYNSNPLPPELRLPGPPTRYFCLPHTVRP